MKARSLFILPILSGVAICLAGSGIFYFLVSFIVGFTLGEGSTAKAMQVMENPIINLPILMVFIAFSILAGYVAARMAKTNKLFHSVVVSGIVTVLGIILGLLVPVASDEYLLTNILIDIVSIIVTAFTIYVGGLLAISGEETQSTHFYEKWNVSTKTFVIAVLAVSLAYCVLDAFAYDSIPKCTVETLYIQGDMYSTAPTVSDEDAATSGESQPETYSSGFASIVEEINENDDIKAIFVDINSPGGDPVAGEEIANALKQSNKEVVVLIRSIGASSAYWAATGADIIFASGNSDVGGIGVQVNYLDAYEKNRKEGINSNIISSAKFKSLGDPNLPLTAEERAIIQRDVDEIHTNFVEAVAENRGLPVEEVRKIADGSTMLGSRGLEAKLIDRIGDMYAVKEYLREKFGEEPKICETYYQ